MECLLVGLVLVVSVPLLSIFLGCLLSAECPKWYSDAINNSVKWLIGKRGITLPKKVGREMEKVITLEEVKRSDCGCSQCLWAGVECKNYEKFSPKWSEVFKQPSCQNYAYCD